MSQAPPNRRRWVQFGLGTMFVVMTVFALWLGWQLKFIRERQAYIQHCDDLGRPCVMATEDVAKGFGNSIVPPPTIPIWRQWLGDQAVAYVGLPRALDDPEAYDAEVQRQFMADCERLFPEAVQFGRELARKYRQSSNSVGSPK